jgi:site-specific DNA-methyltransferase (adenine-specific)/adenine-specific DNA-methyltransferase
VLGRAEALVSPRSTEASITLDGGRLVISAFHPASLLSKLSQNAAPGAWRELVDSVLIDFHYDGAVLRPTLSDVPERGELVAGSYEVPPDATRIRVKITDIVSDVFETSVARAQ